ncbi:MAG: efflux RND transporter periplasmic adaptor subunit [Myxococcota bacterium]
MDGRRRKHILPLLLLGVGAVLVALLVGVQPSPSRTEPAPISPLVRVVEAIPETISLRVHAQGTVVPRTESDLVPEVAGRVEWVSPDLVSGGTFESGEPLVRIERADHQAELESARAAVARTRSEASRAAKELRRQRTLAGRSVTSQARIDDAENASRVADALALEAKAKLARAQRDLERTELRAPYTGRVREESVDPGQFVNRGTAIARLYAVDYAEVRLPLPDRELAYLDESVLHVVRGADGLRPRATLRAEFAGGSHEWRGEIVRSEGEIDARSRMVHIVARVEDPYGLAADPTLEAPPPLAVGLFVDAEIEGRSIENAFVLPREVLHVHRGQEGQVWVVDAEDRIRVQDVEVLRTERTDVVITAGLGRGDRVLRTRLRAPIDGMSVRVASPDTAPNREALAERKQ